MGASVWGLGEVVGYGFGRLKGEKNGALWRKGRLYDGKNKNTEAKGRKWGFMEKREAL